MTKAPEIKIIFSLKIPSVFYTVSYLCEFSRECSHRGKMCCGGMLLTTADSKQSPIVTRMIAGGQGPGLQLCFGPVELACSPHVCVSLLW